ncbi:MAG: 4-alpha-glucanotransferase, partial [Bacteroidaceae bacterium]|nr:4-alpha-glucanotransferase [Bacteroidaceae bacterium]MCF0196388.1 4-alpha-glucanotransferase [Bacteroidaceae bacterium]
RYTLREGFSTQKSVEAFFANRTDDTSAALRDGLYRLIANVLFVKVSDSDACYHPRIAVLNEPVFMALSARQKESFRHLYEDFFYHRHEAFWQQQALRNLPALLQATSMLPCAEDLGMLPACVATVLKDLSILSLEIQSMPKEPGVPFSHIENNPYLSVSTPFTHDMPTLRLWWMEDTVRTQHYYNQILQHDGFAPHDIPDWLCEEIVCRHLYCPSMLVLISLQDWLSIDAEARRDNPRMERINIPSSPHHYWRYRMHLTIEQLMANTGLTHRIRTLIHRSGRTS